MYWALSGTVAEAAEATEEEGRKKALFCSSVSPPFEGNYRKPEGRRPEEEEEAPSVDSEGRGAGREGKSMGP